MSGPVPVIVTRQAKADVTRIRQWYRRERPDRPDVEQRFAAALVEALEAVADNPEAFAADASGVRHRRLTGVMYAAHFELTPDAAVVFAVLHLHQDPETWRSHRRS